MIEFSVPKIQLLTLVVGTILPLLVGLVTVRVTHPGKKAALLAMLAAVGGLGGELLTALTTGSRYDLGVGAITAVATFLVATGMHYGIWKPSGAAEALQKVGETPEARAEADRADAALESVLNQHFVPGQSLRADIDAERTDRFRGE